MRQEGQRLPSQTVQIGEERRTEQSSPEFRTVRSEHLGAVWPRVEPYIARALRHGQGDATTTEHVKAGLLLGNTRMWVALEDEEILGGIIWSARRVDTGQKLWIEFIFGRDLERWLDELMELGRDMKEITGSFAIEASCRPGLVKILKQHGWRQKAVVMEM